MKVKKIIFLMITILIPLICTGIVAGYSYNRYDPEIYTNLDSEFKQDLTIKNGVSTLERINLYRKLENYYYDEDPIYCEDVEYGGEKIFTLAIYRGWGVIKDYETDESRYDMKYDLFIYNVNYTKIQKELGKQFSSSSTVYDYSDPYFVINICPTADMDEDESIFTSGYTETITTGASINLYDIDSTPELDGGTPYHVHRVTIRENNISSSIKKLFKDGKAYISVSAEIYKDFSEDGTSQRYTKTLENVVEDEVEGFEVYASEFDVEEHEKGWRESAVRDTLENAGYNWWLFTHYIWWQLLLALVISSLIMLGFYFAFTYEEPEQRKIKRKKK